MFHYVAVIWNTADPSSRAEATTVLDTHLRLRRQWRRLFYGDGLAVFADAPEREDFKPYTLQNNGGVILGRLFKTQVDAAMQYPDADIEQRNSLKCGGSDARQFCELYWGTYVAFFSDVGNRRTRVVRDCSGRVPCYWMRIKTLTLVFSDINDVHDLSDVHFSINWTYIAAFLHYEQLQIRESGLNEVREVLAGDWLEIDSSGVKQDVLWDPRRFAREPIFATRDNASAQLRCTTQACVSSWASSYEKIIHSLSGGLDSAVVLGCLSRAARRPDVTCVNRFTETANEDEREFARLAATQARVALIERHWSNGTRALDSAVLALPSAAKPCMAVVVSCLDLHTQNELASQLEAQAVWTGQGGDHLFIAGRTAVGAQDFARLHGFRPGLLRVISESATISRESYWSIARSTISDWRLRNPWAPAHLLDRKPLFTNPDALPTDIVQYMAHPWTQDIEDLVPGKQYHVSILSEVANRHRPTANMEIASEHHPLLSQPLMELALRIPIYTLLSGGRPRGLARTAFKEYVPREILDRETKGSTMAHWMRHLMRNRSFLRDLLFDGILRRHGLINVPLLERYLAQTQHLRAEHFARFFSCVSAEIWAQSLTRDQKTNAA